MFIQPPENKSDSFFYPARTQAASANPDFSGAFICGDFNWLQVSTPLLRRGLMGMADAMTKHWSFMTNLTYFRHDYSLPFKLVCRAS